MQLVRHSLFISLLGIFSVSASVFFVPSAHGAIEPPYKEIDYCYRIDNISAYPDFVLIARFPSASEGYGYPIQLKEDECYARNTRDEIVAVPIRKRFQASDMEAGIFNSGIRTPVSPVKIYDPQDPRKKIEDIFTIDALGGQTFSLRLAKKIITLDDGTSKEKVYATAEEGLADPPGTGYEYTDTPITIVENPERIDRAWYQQDWAKGLFIFVGGMLIVHFYVVAALFTLARRLAVRHRWRAWVPIANLSLFVSLAGQRQRRFVLLCVIIFIFFALVVAASRFSGCRMYASGLDVCYPEQIRTFFGWFSNFILLYFLVLLCRLYAAFTIRCGRPWWWGPLMVLVPPVGLVLLGIMAWSKPRA